MPRDRGDSGCVERTAGGRRLEGTADQCPQVAAGVPLVATKTFSGREAGLVGEAGPHEI